MSVRAIVTIALREADRSVRDLRFIGAFAICIASVVGSVVINMQSYAQKSVDYRSTMDSYARAIEENTKVVYGLNITPKPIARKPVATQFIALAGEQDPDPKAVAKIEYSPWFHGELKKNPLPALFFPADLVFVLGLVMPLFVFALAYDGLAGDVQQAALQLILSGPVSRSVLIIGKWLGAMLSMLLVYCALASAAGLVLACFSQTVPVSRTDILATVSFFGVGLLYTCAVASLALMVSSFFRSSASAMLCLVLVWLLGFVALPYSATSVAFVATNPPGIASFEHRIDAVGHMPFNTYNHDIRMAVAKKLGLKMEDVPPQIVDSVYLWVTNLKNHSQERMIRAVNEEDGHFNVRRAGYMDEALMTETNWERRVESLAQWIRRISPYGCFLNASVSLANTGFARELQLREMSQRYLADFAVLVVKLGYSARPLEGVDLPVPVLRDVPVSQRLQTSLIDCAAIFLFGVLAFLITYRNFMRRELT